MYNLKLSQFLVLFTYAIVYFEIVLSSLKFQLFYDCDMLFFHNKNVYSIKAKEILKFFRGFMACCD